MKKPSIFSKDYEKIMRKRKRKRIVIGILSICIIGILVTEVANYDFSKLKDRLQAWVDEDKEKYVGDQLVDTDESIGSTEVEEPVVEEVPSEKYLDVTISDTPISFKIKEENSQILIESVKEVPENYYIYIGNNGKDAVVLDPNQNINIVYASGEIKNVTLAQYIGPDGEVYIKDNIISLFDREDYYKYFKDHRLCIDKRGYVVRGQIKVHRLIMNVNDPKLTIDHINGNPLDNRKINLRICTQSNNCKNKSINSNNKSGIVGVYFDNRTQKWVASIKVNYKKINLGYFNTLDEAAKVRKEAEEKYFGDYSIEKSRNGDYTNKNTYRS